MKLDRRNQIVDMVNRQRTVKNSELMETFGISIETVRRDLESLEKQGYLHRVYGGAVAGVSLSSEPEYTRRSKAKFAQKLAIAAAAAELVQPKDSIYMGVGTTVQAMTRYLRDVGRMTVFTNALRTAVEMSEIPNCSVILSGGTVRPKELTVSGFPAEGNFTHFNVDKAFIGIGGITESGVTDFHIDEANLHRQMVKNARQAIVLADSAKLGTRGVVNVCPLEDVDIVITDSGVSRQMVRMLEQAGIRVIVAKK